MLCCALGLTLSASACGDDPARSAAASADTSETGAAASRAAAARFSSEKFSVPFDVDVPRWLPAEPSVEESNFVTWESTTADRKVRVLVPVSVYRPGDPEPTPPPTDYLAYLREQTASGAVLTDERTLEVSGRSVTVMTATTDRALDGSLGCQADGMTAANCFGLQPDLLLRIAVIPLDDTTLLAWSRAVRDEPGTDEQLADFDDMLASLDLR
jgi:hypothetical protein